MGVWQELACFDVLVSELMVILKLSWLVAYFTQTLEWICKEALLQDFQSNTNNIFSALSLFLHYNYVAKHFSNTNNNNTVKDTDEIYETLCNFFFFVRTPYFHITTWERLYQELQQYQTDHEKLEIVFLNSSRI